MRSSSKAATETSIVLWPALRAMADAACVAFSLNMHRMEPLTNLRARHFGDCDDAGSHVVRLRVHRLGRPNRPLARATILDTLAHELAHLRERRHGREHRTLAYNIVQFWKEKGW